HRGSRGVRDGVGSLVGSAAEGVGKQRIVVGLCPRRGQTSPGLRPRGETGQTRGVSPGVADGIVPDGDSLDAAGILGRVEHLVPIRTVENPHRSLRQERHGRFDKKVSNAIADRSRRGPDGILEVEG
ncbi:MAG: hypothetical protein ACK56F_07030, partial [bacterium]